ncbi:MAG: pirin family protein [Aureispira sp.]|nr:pirin family protein [Aureispira sp.]
MKRKDFLKKTALGALGTALGLGASKKATASPKIVDQVGFNHLPNKEESTMKTVLHKANTRGYADHGWLNSHHSFSFANYRNPERMHFGVLRVLNDDVVAGGRGFGKHPHDNMEIISIPLEGDLEHKDSMGNTTVIQQGDVQVMSAGTGIFHSEYNKNKDKAVKFLQIWVFPNKRDVKPRYDQITLKADNLKNQFHQILSPNDKDEGVWIHQNAWFHLGKLEKGHSTSYTLKDNANNGVYAFMLEGEATIADQKLDKRDGLGMWDMSSIEIKATNDAKILLMEVPMKIG